MTGGGCWTAATDDTTGTTTGGGCCDGTEGMAADELGVGEERVALDISDDDDAERDEADEEDKDELRDELDASGGTSPVVAKSSGVLLAAPPGKVVGSFVFGCCTLKTPKSTPAPTPRATSMRKKKIQPLRDF